MGDIVDWTDGMRKIFFENCELDQPEPHQTVTSSGRAPDGLDDLFGSMQKIGRGSVCWNKAFNLDRLVDALASMFNTDADLLKLDLLMSFAYWRARREDFLLQAGGASVGLVP